MSHSSTARIHSLDALRGGALLLGILFHAAFSFMPGDQLWLVMDNQRSGVIAGLAYTLHIFRMPLFFLLAGYFARMQINRLGTGAFLRDRLKRIGVPLIVFWPIIIACFVALAIYAAGVAEGGSAADLPSPPPPTLETFPLTHLWFLYFLLFIYAVTVVVRSLLSIGGLRARLASVSDSILDWKGSPILLPAFLAIPIALSFINQPEWHPFFGIPAPEEGFVPNRIAIVGYGSAFLIGWLLQRDLRHIIQMTRLWPYYLATAAMLTLYCFMQVGAQVTLKQSIPQEAHLLYPFAYAIAIWTWTLGLMGLSMKLWSKESIVRRYVADASYWIYLIHLPIVIAFQIWASQLDMNPETKFLVIIALAVPLMLLSYELLVRYTFVGWLLNNRKRRRGARKVGDALA